MNKELLFDQSNPITDDDLKAARSKYSLRRADRFTALAIAAISKLITEDIPEETGLITVSSFGPHKTVFATLDGILDYPEDAIQPTKFSHSVHNAAASYIGTIFKIKGPTFAITGFDDIWEQATCLAETLLAAQMCPQIIVIQIEESGLLTQSAPSLWEERFPSPPAEYVRAALF